MQQDRRRFLMGGLSCLPLAATGAYAFFQRDKNKSLVSVPSLLLSSISDNSGQHYVAAMDQMGKPYYRVAIPERAHDSLYNTRKRQAIYFGRSPSTSIYVVDIISGGLATVIKASKNRHFYGHGVIDKSQRYLYVVENNTALNQGRIGIYDAEDNYKKISEIASYGVEPHQIALLSDGVSLVVANGGRIKDSRNSIINKKSFTSSLAYIDSQHGRLLASYPSQFLGNSLRHLTVAKHDKVFIGAQSHSEDTNPLVFSHKGEDNLSPFIAEDYIWQGHNNYTASLAVYDNTLIVSSPRGNSLSFWDTQNKQCIMRKHYLDVAGIAINNKATSAELWVTTGQGMLMNINKRQPGRRYRTKNIAWDNHLSLAILS